jgi:hypothetical protein
MAYHELAAQSIFMSISPPENVRAPIKMHSEFTTPHIPTHPVVTSHYFLRKSLVTTLGYTPKPPSHGRYTGTLSSGL